jgi:hypothetical protein
MFRYPRLVLAIAVLALAASARADFLRLLSPESGTVLRGGSRAELRWSATNLPADAEEWEAFLSVDGGKYYGFRVTPHLEIDLRRFTFTVPNVDTRDARILIRAGDEKEETEFEIPGSFSIVRDPDAVPILAAEQSFAHGEAAREGDPEVLSWTEGARDGSGVRQEMAPVTAYPELDQHPKARSDESAEGSPEDDSGGALTIAREQPSSRGGLAYKIASPAIFVDLLLVCRRRNI